jgi:diguanylate cyclase (GGDEF)-like protein
MTSPDALSLAGIGPRVARAGTLASACALIVEEVGAALQAPCAILGKSGKSWAVEAATPHGLELPPLEGGVGTSVVPLGNAGGVARELLIMHGTAAATDAAWLDVLGRALTDALMLVALRADADTRRQRNARFHRFAGEMLLKKGGPPLHRRIVEKMAQAVGADTGSLALYQPSEEALVIAATYGYPSVLVDHIRIKRGEAIVGRVFATGRWEHARVTATPGAPGRQRRYRGDSYMAVPLRTADGVLGVVSVTESKDGQPFSRAQLATLRAYAIPAALALAREALRDQTAGLAHLATVDALTGIWNRRHFDERLTEEIHRASREHSDLALLMIDIDDFKALNDARGHLSGDGVLREVGDILRRSVRTFDICARYGGEEFAILMPGASASTAFQIAERIRRQTESHFANTWRFAAGVRPTLSIGVSAARGDMNGEALIATADSALLWAKAAGKNVVKLYADMPERRSSA